MSTIIRSCSPGTKCEYILNDQAILSFFKANELEKFIEDDNARSMNDIGVYIGYSSDTSIRASAYSGESTTEDSGGVEARIEEHRKKKPDLTDYMVLTNTTIDGHRKLDGNLFKFFEHLFRCTLNYAGKSEIVNVKRTSGRPTPEMYQKIICPLLVDMRYTISGVLSDLLIPDNDLPAKPNDGKTFIIRNEFNEVYLKDSVILKHSHFKFPHKKIRESNDCYTLLCNLINAGLCIPYVHNNEVVMKFIVDTNLNNAHVINGSQKKDFFINERLLVSLMGSNVEFKDSFKK